MVHPAYIDGKLARNRKHCLADTGKPYELKKENTKDTRGKVGRTTGGLFEKSLWGAI